MAASRTATSILLSALACGCGAADESAPPPASQAPAPRLRILEANVGNLDEAFGGPCPAAPYHGTTCSLAEEQVLRAHVDALSPDVVFLLEVLDEDLCPPESFAGAPDLVCTDAPARQPRQQARRLVGDEYTIVCDGVAHYDCLAVRSSLVTLEECPPGEACLGGADTPPEPPECAAKGGISSVSRAHASIHGKSWTLVVAHPLNATNAIDDACRLAQYRLALEQLPSVVAPNLIAGDWNMDPYRLPHAFPSAEYWHTAVGEGRRFHALNVTKDPPLVTWGVVATLDYVVSDVLEGDCSVLGVSEGTERLDGTLAKMDHRAVVCDVAYP